MHCMYMYMYDNITIYLLYLKHSFAEDFSNVSEFQHWTQKPRTLWQLN